MEMIKEFINQYGYAIISLALTGLAGFIGNKFKQLYEKKVNNKIKKEDAETVVKFVEQKFHDLKGEDKFEKAADNLSEMLEKKGITVSSVEIMILIEAAVSEFNKPWLTEDIEDDPEPEEGDAA